MTGGMEMVKEVGRPAFMVGLVWMSRGELTGGMEMVNDDGWRDQSRRPIMGGGRSRDCWPKPGLLAEQAGVIMIKEKKCLHCTVE